MITPASGLFTSKDPFFKIISFAVIVGMILAFKAFVFVPTLFNAFLILLMFAVIIALELLVPHISNQVLILIP